MVKAPFRSECFPDPRLWPATLLLFVVVASGAEAQIPAVQDRTDVYQDPNYAVPALEEPRYQPQAVSGPLFKKQSRNGFLQSLRHSTTLVAAGAGDLASQEYDFSATGALPAFSPETPLILTPFFGWDSFDQEGLDVPNDLYEASFEFRHLRPIFGNLTADMAIKPGFFGDLESGANEFRLQGKLAGIWKTSDTTSWVFGATYLDREDIQVLPIAGVLWYPNENFKFDLVFPAPKIAVRAWRDCRSAWWVYTAGEFGGGSWGIQRADGSDDVMTLRDLRLRVGLEREAQLVSGLVEIGYVFGRELEYTSGVGNTSLTGAAMVRAGIYY